jgi:predicted metal-binding membrane protein
MHVHISMRFDGLFDCSGMVCLAQGRFGHVLYGWHFGRPPVYHLRAALHGGLYDLGCWDSAQRIHVVQGDH